MTMFYYPFWRNRKPLLFQRFKKMKERKTINFKKNSI